MVLKADRLFNLPGLRPGCLADIDSLVSLLASLPHFTASQDGDRGVHREVQGCFTDRASGRVAADRDDCRGGGTEDSPGSIDN